MSFEVVRALHKHRTYTDDEAFHLACKRRCRNNMLNSSTSMLWTKNRWDKPIAYFDLAILQLLLFQWSELAVETETHILVTFL